MEVMGLKHGFSLVIIILLCHNVALQSPEKEYPSFDKETIMSKGESSSDIDISMEMEEPKPGENVTVSVEKAKPGENVTVSVEKAKPGENVIVSVEKAKPGENETVPIEETQLESNESVSEEDAISGEKGTVNQEKIFYRPAPVEGVERSSEESKQSSHSDKYRKKAATFRWPSGTVPYHIRRRDYDAIIIARIRAAMQEIERSSCVIFKDVSRDTEAKNGYTPWLSIENPDNHRECTHTTFREVGNGKHTKAILTLGYDCMQYRDILHALLHALGFADEVTHPQRDKYVRIVWPNIKPEYRPFFYPKKSEIPQTMVEYDSMSVMHFHDRAYTINGKATIVPQVPGLLIAPSDTLSQLDVMKLRISFGHVCNKRKVADLLETCQNALTYD